MKNSYEMGSVRCRSGSAEDEMIFGCVDGDLIALLEMDVTSLDVEDVARRFKNIRARDFNPKSLEVYESRFKNALSSFREYVRDPGAWCPASRQRSQNSVS
ncbi:MAG TPA: hypothetical protein VIT00_10250, partial [Terrimicrobiaceae bacterium]